jgi:hypothetical protein
MAQAPAKVRIQLDQQALNAIPGDERVGLDVREDTSLAAQALKAHSPPGKALPIIYLIAGNLSLPSIRSAVQEMLRRREYGGVVIDTRASGPADIRNDPAAQADTLLVIRADGSTASVRATLVTEDFLKGVLDYHGQWSPNVIPERLRGNRPFRKETQGRSFRANEPPPLQW